MSTSNLNLKIDVQQRTLLRKGSSSRSIQFIPTIQEESTSPFSNNGASPAEQAFSEMKIDSFDDFNDSSASLSRYPHRTHSCPNIHNGVINDSYSNINPPPPPRRATFQHSWPGSPSNIDQFDFRAESSNPSPSSCQATLLRSASTSRIVTKIFPTITS
mmetsp:Transcript_4479/g.5829  ORF Transcript_4479/g.5829 Transcript_4479/m.5829 type:complete len:159 (-) Transcript_4479:89-565(-)